MKKLSLYIFLVLLVLGGLFAYLLYSEGAFESRTKPSAVEAKPFMKCAAGKCGAGKCGAK